PWLPSERPSGANSSGSRPNMPPFSRPNFPPRDRDCRTPRRVAPVRRCACVNPSGGEEARGEVSVPQPAAPRSPRRRGGRGGAGAAVHVEEDDGSLAVGGDAVGGDRAGDAAEGPVSDGAGGGDAGEADGGVDGDRRHALEGRAGSHVWAPGASQKSKGKGQKS